MSDIIQLLPDSVANQIAAGEVIQRPASVIKELIENAIDAGATRIDVSVVDAGRTSIQVIDNGKGMSDTDARLSFERHATSKIRQADDLFSLHTMGFRGEALASIAAVAQVELKTRLHNEELGTHLVIAGSSYVSQEPCACPEGSNFLVENLFYNVPARRKFLKSNTTELNNIITAFERIALVYPDIAFTFHSNGSEMYNLRAMSLRQRIVDIFGKRINQDLLPVKVNTSVCGISGFVGKPESARKKGAKQYFFVNGRYMRHPYFSKAVLSAFDRLLPQGEQVPYFIYFTVQPEDIDVNIHPTKTEIKFENEQAIWQILMAAVKDAVGAFNDVSTIDFDVEGKPDIPVFNSQGNSAAPEVDYNPQYNPFTDESHLSSGNIFTPSSVSQVKPSRVGHDTGAVYRSKVTDNWDELYTDLEQNQPDVHQTIFPEQPGTSPTDSMIAEKSPSHYQYKGRFIMTAVKSGLMVVDQHRAHIRILFEQYQQQLVQHKMHSQKVLFPETVNFSARERVLFDKVSNQLAAMGFELLPLGDNVFSINAIPEGLEGVDIPGLLHDMIDHEDHPAASPVQNIFNHIALTMARAAAIPYGQVLSNDEMENVINSLFICSNVNYTPDGKNILFILKQKEMEQMLGGFQG
ncbi:MAG: DNA mismatch repair endonuclease MutL [Prevotellaceae bacterium]|nr:DNA mismatch repair endonuclease MutL [Prevotellaceae bacterium]